MLGWKRHEVLYGGKTSWKTEKEIEITSRLVLEGPPL
jgi:hypothetical protein